MLHPLQAAPPYITLDGSTIRELSHPDHGGVSALSLAQATVAPGRETQLHLHRESTEIYHFSSGVAEVIVGEETFAVAPGSTISISPSVPHRVRNTGPETLVFLCACAPPYRHEDTELL